MPSFGDREFANVIENSSDSTLQAATTAFDTKDQAFKRAEKDVEDFFTTGDGRAFADADDTMFEEEYDIFQSIFGTGKLLGIPVPYLQTGHGILLLVTLLAAFVYAPGLPLTEFPPEIRSFFGAGLGVIYTINAVVAISGFFAAKEKNMSGVFWAVKCFLLGGVAYYEITKVVRDPTKKQIRDPFDGLDPSDKKSKSRRK